MSLGGEFIQQIQVGLALLYPCQNQSGLRVSEFLQLMQTEVSQKN